MNPERSSPRYEDSCCMLLPSAMYLIISYCVISCFKMSLFFPVCIVFLCLWEKEQRIGVCFLFSCVSPRAPSCGLQECALGFSCWSSCRAGMHEAPLDGNRDRDDKWWQNIWFTKLSNDMGNLWKMSERRDVCKSGKYETNRRIWEVVETFEMVGSWMARCRYKFSKGPIPRVTAAFTVYAFIH